MSKFKAVWLIVAGVSAIVILAFALELGGLQWKSFFAPKHAAVQRQVFKETRSYNEAKVQALIKYRREYVLAKDDDTQKSLAGLIRVEFAEFYADSKADDLEPTLREFLRKIMEN